MSKDIIKYLLTKNEVQKKPKINNEINKIFKVEKNNKFNKERNIINSGITNQESNIKLINNEQIMDSLIEQKSPRNSLNSLTNKEKTKIIKKLNYCDLIKSIISSHDKKSELFSSCIKIINEDASINSLLKRIYKLERIYYILPKRCLNKFKIYKDKRFKEINKNFLQFLDPHQNKKYIREEETFNKTKKYQNFSNNKKEYLLDNNISNSESQQNTGEKNKNNKTKIININVQKKNKENIIYSNFRKIEMKNLNK